MPAPELPTRKPFAGQDQIVSFRGRDGSYGVYRESPEQAADTVNTLASEGAVYVLNFAGAEDQVISDSLRAIRYHAERRSILEAHLQRDTV